MLPKQKYPLSFVHLFWTALYSEAVFTLVKFQMFIWSHSQLLYELFVMPLRAFLTVHMHWCFSVQSTISGREKCVSSQQCQWLQDIYTLLAFSLSHSLLNLHLYMQFAPPFDLFKWGVLLKLVYLVVWHFIL